MFGISLLPIIPLRNEPSSKSEMVSQLLFGEKYKVLHQQPDWYKIQTVDDGYIGWINDTQVHIMEEQTWNNLLNPILVQSYPSLKIEVNKVPMHIPFGSKIYLNNDYFKHCNFNIESEPKTPLLLANMAKQYLNSPYLWGGKSPFGIDCSGFSQIIFSQLGIQLKRDANQQAEQGQLITFLLEAKVGDLAFFENEEGRIVHVGILLGSDHIIHAYGMIRIDSIDNHGIINSTSRKYSHKLRFIKRLL